jgi:hypothetical protein
VKGIEPSSLAWEARALPLSYTRLMKTCRLVSCIHQIPPRTNQAK